MERGVSITQDIAWIGTNDNDTALFENIWPLPRGISYNAYVIADRKVALVDTVKKGFTDALLEGLASRLGKDRPVDYLIINHMEPDHSGSVAALRRVYPELRIIGNAKTADLLDAFYRIGPGGIQVIQDGAELDLGRHKLKFLLTPMVHWPETMMTFDQTDRVLFSGDAFGGFGTLPGGIFDDEVDIEFFQEETLRYFSNIIAKYSLMVQKAIARLRDLDIAVVASTHGPVWRKRPRQIIELYDRWSAQRTEPGVAIVYGSMYGHTERMANALARGLAEAGITRVRMHNVSRTHPSFILNDVWRFKGLAFGTPTYNTSVFPLLANLLDLLTNMKLTERAAGVFGSYGWSGGGVKGVQAHCQAANYRLVEPVVEAHCAPTGEDLAACHQLGQNLAAAVKGT